MNIMHNIETDSHISIYDLQFSDKCKRNVRETSLHAYDSPAEGIVVGEVAKACADLEQSFHPLPVLSTVYSNRQSLWFGFVSVHAVARSVFCRLVCISSPFQNRALWFIWWRWMPSNWTPKFVYTLRANRCYARRRIVRRHMSFVYRRCRNEPVDQV